MKKKLLFVIESLTCAGAEKSLVSLLNLLDYSRFDVDLQLFSYGGELERYLPREVNLLPPLKYFQFLGKSFTQQLCSWQLGLLSSRLNYSLRLRLNKQLNNPQKAVLLWESAKKYIFPNEEKHYDVAIAYAQGVPTFYVAENVSAHKKASWVNVPLKLDGDLRSAQQGFYEKSDHIVCVSDASYDAFSKVYPHMAHKMKVIWDIVDPHFIQDLSLEPLEKPLPSSDVPILLTVARLNKAQKGFDITMEAARILKEKGVPYRWYVLGKGPYRAEMEAFIEQHQLQNQFFLLGTTSNPYPYFRACDVYVQTSRFEGFGLSIAEARLLDKPVVTTEFEAVYNQMIQGGNGLVTDIDPIAVADAIERLLNDKELYDHIVSFQQNEKKGNPEEINKFYDLISQ
jgi:glycosyltransferase involved in cell wall biosynthesis